MKHYPTLAEIKAAAQGNWQEIHACLGVPAHLLNTRKHQACPHCGGRDRFRFTDYQGNGGFICNQCAPSGGSGFDLLMMVFGLDFNESVKQVARTLGLGSHEPLKYAPRLNLETQADTQQDKQLKLLEQWNHAQPLQRGDVVERYLINRGLPLWNIEQPLPTQIRKTVAPYWTPTIDGKYMKLGDFICMLAAIRLPDGELQGLHFTYLVEEGGAISKLTAKHPETGESLPAKKMQSRFSGSLNGAAVYLHQPDQQGRLMIAEGIETALAAHELFGLPVIAALSANGMRSVQIPPDVKELFVITDNDHNKTGFNAAHELGLRALKQGIKGNIWQPPFAGTDALDEYINRNSRQENQA